MPNPFPSATTPLTLAQRIDTIEAEAGVAGPLLLVNNPSADQTIAGAYRLISPGGFAIPNVGVVTGTMTLMNNAELHRALYRWDWTNAMIAALGASGAGDITICTIPAQAMVINALMVVKTPDTSANALTGAVGRAAATYLDYIKASDLKAAANTIYGAVSGDRGTNLTGYDVPSWTATTAIKMHLIKSATNLNTVTACTGSVYLELKILP